MKFNIQTTRKNKQLIGEIIKMWENCAKRDCLIVQSGDLKEQDFGGENEKLEGRTNLGGHILICSGILPNIFLQ